MIENVTFITIGIDNFSLFRDGSCDPTPPKLYDLPSSGVNKYAQTLNIGFKASFCQEKEILLIERDYADLSGRMNTELFKFIKNEFGKFVFLKDKHEFSKFYREFIESKITKILEILNSKLKGWEKS